MPPWWYKAAASDQRGIKAYRYESMLPLRVMDNLGGAGFYASVWGPLPYAVSQSPLENYRLYEALTRHSARRKSE